IHCQGLLGIQFYSHSTSSPCARALLKPLSSLPYTFVSFKGMSTLRLLLGRKASSSCTALQDIVGGVYICIPPPVSCTQDCGVAILFVSLPLNLALVLGPLDCVKHSDICVRHDRSWNVSRTSVRPAWPRLHYTEYPRPAAALTSRYVPLDPRTTFSGCNQP